MTPFGRLPQNCLNHYPSGRWGFVGSVDARLAYVRKDGSPATDDDLAGARIGEWRIRWSGRTQREAVGSELPWIGAEVSQ